MTITVYSFQKAGDEYGCFTTQDYHEAKDYARDNRCVIIANEFEWADSERLDSDDYQTAADRRAERRTRTA